MPDTPPYLCWEEHHEDLTEKVNDELQNSGDITLYFKRKSGARKPAKVFVSCSEGHLNVFEPAVPDG